jgi:homoaconitase/3-isopropylmalate dehydratase large subunit
MSIAGRMTLCNMSVEMGAKNGIIEPDETTRKFLEGRVKSLPNFEALKSDKDAVYERTVQFDVSKMEPQVACPSSVDNVKPVSEVGNVPIEQAFIGSCTNGRIEDLRLAAQVLKGKRVKDGVRAIVIPASQEVYSQALQEGLLEIFTDAGAIVCGSGCGPCLGGHIGLLAAGETCVSTSNRNFIGRMGSTEASVFLSSPATVAASAVTGKITDPRKLGTEA